MWLWKWKIIVSYQAYLKKLFFRSYEDKQNTENNLVNWRKILIQIDIFSKNLPVTNSIKVNIRLYLNQNSTWVREDLDIFKYFCYQIEYKYLNSAIWILQENVFIVCTWYMNVSWHAHFEHMHSTKYTCHISIFMTFSTLFYYEVMLNQGFYNFSHKLI